MVVEISVKLRICKQRYMWNLLIIYTAALSWLSIHSIIFRYHKTTVSIIRYLDYNTGTNDYTLFSSDSNLSLFVK